jgi:hypothetical protein
MYNKLFPDAITKSHSLLLKSQDIIVQLSTFFNIKNKLRTSYRTAHTAGVLRRCGIQCFIMAQAMIKHNVKMAFMPFFLFVLA